jgi:hypothetical protein
MSVSKDSVELCQYPLLISHPVHCDLNSLFLSKCIIIALVRKTYLTIKSTFLLRFGCIGGGSVQGVLHTTNLWTTWIWLKSMISEKMLVLRLLLILCPRLDLGILSVRDWGGFFLDAHCEGMINGYFHVMVVLQLQINCRELKRSIVYFSHWDHPCLAQSLRQQSMVVHFFWPPELFDLMSVMNCSN